MLHCVPLLAEESVVLTITAKQMQVFAASQETNYRRRLEAFVRNMLDKTPTPPPHLDAPSLTEKILSTADTICLYREDHIAQLAVIVVAIACSKRSIDRQKLFNILERTEESADERLFECAGILAIIEPAGKQK